MEQIMNYVKPELLILIPVLYFIGMGLKKSKMDDRYIPLCLGGVGVLLAILYVLSTAALGTMQDWLYAIFLGLTQGILCAGCSVYVNQLIKQGSKTE